MKMETQVQLDRIYMDEDAVELLAHKAVEQGLPIEPFLDYLDEDADKKLIMKLYKNK